MKLGRWMAILTAAALLAGCKGEADVVDHCLESGAGCPACTSSEECVFAGNPCLKTVYCTHRKAGVAVAEIGCDSALEYSWPDDEECACVSSVCRSAE